MDAEHIGGDRDRAGRGSARGDERGVVDEADSQGERFAAVDQAAAVGVLVTLEEDAEARSGFGHGRCKAEDDGE
jgi:hypothetical protein